MPFCLSHKIDCVLATIRAARLAQKKARHGGDTVPRRVSTCVSRLGAGRAFASDEAQDERESEQRRAQR